jgi:hypothetical protein
VLHATLERWLKADARGIDPTTGEPVELYPPGWEVAWDYKGREAGSVDPVGQALIQQMVKESINTGTIRREPGRMVEEEMFRRLHIDHTRKVVVYSLGYMDLATDRVVEDHKTISNKKYRKGVKRLARDKKMLSYATELHMRAIERGEPLHEVAMRLVYYYTGERGGTPDISPRQVPVSREAALNFASWTARQAEEMVDLRSKTDWQDVPGADADETSRACVAYGGCIFWQICSGREDVHEHRARVGRLIEAQPLGETTMAAAGSFLAAMKNASATAKNPPATPPPPPPREKIDTEPTFGSVLKRPVLRTDNPVPPWAFSSCKACNKDGQGKTPGFNSLGAPCRICCAMSEVDGTDLLETYTIEVADGRITWAPKGAPVEEAQPVLTAPVPVVRPPQEPGVSVEEGRYVLHGCVPLSLPVVDVIQSYHLFLNDNNPERFWRIDAFKRRDALSQLGNEIRSAYPRGYYHVPTGITDPAIQSFIEQLSFGATVIKATA